jgi:hypothetical protein
LGLSTLFRRAIGGHPQDLLAHTAVHKHPRDPPTARLPVAPVPRNVDAPHVARPPIQPAALRGTVFRGSAAVADGILTPRQLDGKSWRRLYRDVYADASVPQSHRLAVRGAMLVIPDGAVISGRSAAYLWGAAMAEPTGPVAIWSSRSFGPIRGMTIRVSPMSARCITAHRGIPVSTPEHAAWEMAWSLPLFEAMGWIDALARRRHLSRVRLIEHCAVHPGARGRQLARTRLSLADARSESPPESTVRVARVDLAWPDIRFAVEYDGQWHAARDQLTRDRRRLRDLTAAGWQIFHVTRDDLGHVDRLVQKIAAAIRVRRSDLPR